MFAAAGHSASRLFDLLYPASASRSRRIHHVPILTHDAFYKENGVPGFLSNEGVELAWTQYQGLLVKKLNLLTEGTDYANASTKTLLLENARNPGAAALFNYASMAHNNHFFFNCLSPNPGTPMPAKLADMLTADFSSIASLRQELLATAEAMFGPGFVWLVKETESASFKILATYIAGSPYPGAHYRRQPVDMATQSPDTIGGLSGEDYARQTQVQNTAGKFGLFSRTAKRTLGGVSVQPVLCINTWEHVWLRDWGLGNKRGFLEAWWNIIDWKVVEDFADVGETIRREAKKFRR
ncbi:MAG: hypothetical protein M1835_001443 [Candelina submexicana]|nr:MAG: hypothetical protein M1835_001443 [Candelina submexicana]